MPALISLLPLLIERVPYLIRTIEVIFKNKDKSGADKAATLLEWVRALITKMIAAKIPLPDGTLIDTQPADQDLMAALETIFQQTKAKGEETPAATNDTVAGLYIVRGAVTPIR